MADIELVIKMSEKTYKHIMSMQFYIPGVRSGKSLLEEILKAIRTGTPIDLEGLKSDMKSLNCGFPYGLDYLLDCLDKRLGITITEADKGSESKK